MRNRRILVLAVALWTAVFLGLGIYLGQRAAYSDMGIDPARYRELRQELPRARERIVELEGELAGANTRHEVDRASLEMLRRDLAQQQRDIADLNEGLRFYQGLMASGAGVEGVSLRGFELVSGESPGHFSYRLVVQQEARKQGPLRGDLTITVLGLRENQPVSYPLAELVRDMESNAIALEFRYFQVIEGKLEIPEDFAPQMVAVEATITSPHKLELREEYPWRAQESFTDVGE